jgi:hypothetical protein
MGRQANARHAARELAERAAVERTKVALARDAESRAAQYDRAPAAGWLPVEIPRLPDDTLLDQWCRPMLPRFVPDGWRLHVVGLDGWSFVGGPPAHLKLICSGEPHPDGRRWLHCSVTGPDRVPTWEEMVAAKEAFCGAESLAVMVMPPRSEWVNIDPRCLHWWICADGRPLPDFTQGKRTI